MKIGKYPVKRTYSIPRAIADVASALILFILTYMAFAFMSECDTIYGYKKADIQSEELDLLMVQRYLAFIPVVIAFAFTAFTVIFALASKKEPKRYTLNKRTAQRYYVIIADAVTLIRIPVLMAMLEALYYIWMILLAREVSWISVQFICDIVISVIILRFTTYRLERLCEDESTPLAAQASESDSDRIKIKVRAAEKQGQQEQATLDADQDKNAERD